MHCLCIHDELLEKVNKLNYVPVALGDNDYQDGWLRDNIGENNKSQLPDKELKSLAKALRKKCSTGGTFDKDKIELQGNFLEKTALELKANNFSVKILR